MFSMVVSQVFYRSFSGFGALQLGSVRTKLEGAMQKRNRQPRSLAPNPRSRNWRNGPPQDLFLYAQSFHKAAKKLAEAFESDPGPFTDLAAYPVVFMYRHALELHLKAIVLGEGGNFLAAKPDALSVHKTHAVCWLAQFVAQIVTALKWEPEFKCEGIDGLDDFKAVVAEVNSVDPGSYAFRLPGETGAKGAFDVRGFATKIDALLTLLDSTAAGLAAEWDLRSGRVEADQNDGGFEPTIQ